MRGVYDFGPDHTQTCWYRAWMHGWSVFFRAFDAVAVPAERWLERRGW